MLKKREEVDPRLAMALCRYQVIAGYLSRRPCRGERRKLLEELAGERWTGPDGEPFLVKAETIRVWVRRYRRDGLPGLMDKARPSRGTKVLTEEQCALICRLKEEVPQRTLDKIIKIAEETGKVEREVFRRSTVHRVLQSKGISARASSPTDRKDLDRFEAEFPNALWQSDMLVGPWLPDPSRPGKMKRANLFAFLDDHSRLLLDGRFSFQEGLPYLELSFRRALQKWGIPRRVYYDNGKVYRSQHMKQIVATLGIHGITHTTAYRPEGHGKIEALNRFIRNNFIAELKATRITTLDELNEAFFAFARYDYNERVHGETGEPPLARWRTGTGKVRFADEELLRQSFLWKETRTADKSGVLSLLGTKYQVGPKLARRKVEVRFDPEALHEVEVWHGGSLVERVSPFEVSAHRRPVAQSEAPQTQPEAKNPMDPEADWLGHLVGKSRRERLGEPTPRELVEREKAEREAHIVALLDLLSDRLSNDIIDAVAVRKDSARFGILDLEAAETTLDDLLAQGAPRDQHVTFYLAAIRAAQKGGPQ
jgi:putative transposase